jgi:hypothetical protein
MSKFPKAIVASAAVSLGMALCLPFTARAQSNVTTAGTFTVTLNITLKTPLGKGDKVGCSASIMGTSNPNPFGNGGGQPASYDEEASADASVSGSTATCVLMIPYSWLLPPEPRMDFGSGNYTATMTRRATEETAPRVLRSSSSSFVDFDSGGIPSGTTTYSVNVTL